MRGAGEGGRPGRGGGRWGRGPGGDSEKAQRAGTAPLIISRETYRSPLSDFKENIASCRVIRLPTKMSPAL